MHASAEPLATAKKKKKCVGLFLLFPVPQCLFNSSACLVFNLTILVIYLLEKDFRRAPQWPAVGLCT